MNGQVSYAVRSYTIGAGETVQVVRQSSFVTCLEASAGFKIKFDEGPENDFEGGLTYEPDEGFQRVDLRNPGAAPIVVRLAFGRGRVRDARITLSPGLTLGTREDVADVISGYLKEIPTGTNGQVSAANPLRREIIVTNPAVAPGPVHISGQTSTVAHGVELQPGASVTLATTAEIRCWNGAVSNIFLCVLETRFSA